MEAIAGIEGNLDSSATSWGQAGMHAAAYKYAIPAMRHATSVMQISDLPSREVVPGDVVEMHVGDRVPADTRIIRLKTATLRAEQASLTGESVAVLKSTDAVPEEGCELQAKVSLATLSPFATPAPAESQIL